MKCLSLLITTTSQATSQNGGFTHQQIGIFSECQELNQPIPIANLTELNRLARATRKNWNFLIQHNPDWQSQPLIPIHFQSHDVCHNVTSLLEIYTELMLDERYFFQQANKSYMTSSIGSIITHLPDSMNRLLRSMMFGIPIFDPDFKDAMQDFFETHAQFLFKVLHFMNWQKVVLFYLDSSEEGGNFSYQDYYGKTIDILREEQICFYAKILAEGQEVIKDDNSTISWMLRNRPIIALFGTPVQQWKFLLENLDFLNSINLRIIGHELTSPFKGFELQQSLLQYPQKFSDLKIIEFNDHVRFSLYHILSQANYIPLNYIKFSLQKLPTYFKAGFIAKLYNSYNTYRFQFNTALVEFSLTKDWGNYFATIFHVALSGFSS